MRSMIIGSPWAGQSIGVRLVCALLLCLAGFAAQSAEWPADRPAGGFSVDVSDRFLVRAFYNIVHQASEGTPMLWSGDIASCSPGDTGAGFKQAVLARINYFRAMAGVPASLVLRDAFNDAAQEAALMMSANNTLSHYPPPTWACWTSSGADAAENSNLSLGHNGWTAVSGQVRDNGLNNSAVGHRRWLLYPQVQEVGTGDVPGSDGLLAANSVWVNDGRLFDPRPATRDDFVAWPPPGYVPYQVVPSRWSFSHPGADFSAATVTMMHDGSNVPVTLEPLWPPPGSASFLGEPTLVWVPDGTDPNPSDARWPQPAADSRYDLTVSNVLIGGRSQSFSYSVIVFDPQTAGAGEAEPMVSGPVSPPALSDAVYAIDPVPHAVGYEVRSAQLLPQVDVQGAESGLDGIEDGTDAAYPLISAVVSASGDHAFHLAHTSESPPPTQSLTLTDRFLIGPGATLNVKTRMTIATADQVGRVQISLDDGKQWTDLYSQPGAGSPGEASFTQRTLSLAAYAGRVAMFRVIYELPVKATYSWYPQTQDGFGFYVDDIELLDVQRLDSEAVVDLGAATDFVFSPSAAGDFALQARARLWHGFPALAWGPALAVAAVEAAPEDTDGDGVLDPIDNCPLVANAGQDDADGDGIGDACEPAKVYTVSPCRIVDTRGADPFMSNFSGDKLAAGETVNFHVVGNAIDGQGGAGDCGIPPEATGLFANIVVVAPEGGASSGWLTLYPYGEVRPGASTINFQSDTLAIANGVLVPICRTASPACDYDLTVTNAPRLDVHLVIDVTGYLAE